MRGDLGRLGGSGVRRLPVLEHAAVVGRELEIGWLPALINQARNPRIAPNGDRYLDASLTANILEIPTGQPIVYELDANLNALERYYLSER